MRITKQYKRHDGTTFSVELEIDIDALCLYMAAKADRNMSKRCTQVERTVKLKIIGE